MKKMVYMVAFMAAVAFGQDEFAVSGGSKTSIGGYGELHLNYKNVEKKDDKAPTLDFHRFVLFYGYQWNEQWSFKSEVELEHNFVSGGNGELELEQAIINFKHSDAANYQFGVLLPSIGLINENHEPPLFVSVERPEYSKRIIPTTWFGNGVGATGVISDMIDYKVVVMEGLNTANIEDSGIRSGRQKGYKSSLETVLFNARVDYIGLMGLRVGASISRNHLMANNGEQNFEGINLLEVHAKYDANNIYAVTEAALTTYEALANQGLEGSSGFYTEVGYNVGSELGFEEAKLLPWVRYEAFNVASSHTDSAVEEANATTKIAAGLAFKPVDEVVFKADYTYQTKGANDDVTHFIDLGVGYMF
ncbi:MAG: porin [Fibrobacterales bacterium]